MLKGLLLFLAFLMPCHGKVDCLTIQIVNEQICIDKNNLAIELIVRGVNCSDHNLLLYNYNGRIYPGPLREDFICEGKGSAAFELVIYDESSEQMMPEISIPDSIEFQPLEKLKQGFEQGRKEFRKNRLVATPHQEFEVKKKINLKDYQLEKGKYSLMLIYFSGDQMTSMVDPKQINEDEQTYGSRIFQGCAKSNKVALVVE